ncbi:MAG TPA: PoNe immunity protein domain-containing protein [Pyrinomonadaceae bacterium]
MEKREPLMDQAYFDARVAYNRERLKSMEELYATLTTPAANKARYRYSIYRKHFEFLILRYSRGEPVAELAEFFPRVVENLEAYEPPDGEKRLDFHENIDEYEDALWLVSLALLFEVDDDLFERLLALIDNEGEDELYERLVGARAPGRRAASALLYPKPYKLLLRATEASAGEREAFVAEFLRVWYPSMADAYWHESHRGPDGGGFFGYWCIEAAGAVRAFGIDDASFREMRHYPKDLVSPGRAG